MRMLIFWLLLFGCFLYALLRGGWPERVAASTFVAGSFLTAMLGSALPERFVSVEVGILIVDVIGLGIFVALALLTDRYWPIWIASLQLLAVLAHVAKLVDPDMLRNGYGFIMAVWSYPQLLAIALGTRAHHRSRRHAAAI